MGIYGRYFCCCWYFISKIELSFLLEHISCVQNITRAANKEYPWKIKSMKQMHRIEVTWMLSSVLKVHEIMLLTSWQVSNKKTSSHIALRFILYKIEYLNFVCLLHLQFLWFGIAFIGILRFYWLSLCEFVKIIGQFLGILYSFVWCGWNMIMYYMQWSNIIHFADRTILTYLECESSERIANLAPSSIKYAN